MHPWSTSPSGAVTFLSVECPLHALWICSQCHVLKVTGSCDVGFFSLCQTRAQCGTVDLLHALGQVCVCVLKGELKTLTVGDNSEWCAIFF